MAPQLDSTTELQDAEQVVRRLARGFDPHQNARLKPEDICNHPDVIRSLFLAAEALKRASRKREFASTGRPERMGKPWIASEDALLNRAFDDKQCLRSIAAQHKRSSGAILARLVQLGRIREREEGRRILR